MNEEARLPRQNTGEGSLLHASLTLFSLANFSFLLATRLLSPQTHTHTHTCTHAQTHIPFISHPPLSTPHRFDGDFDTQTVMQQFSWRWRLTELLPYGVRSAVKTQHNWLSKKKYLCKWAEDGVEGGHFGFHIH